MWKSSIKSVVQISLYILGLYISINSRQKRTEVHYFTFPGPYFIKINTEYSFFSLGIFFMEVLTAR